MSQHGVGFFQEKSGSIIWGGRDDPVQPGETAQLVESADQRPDSDKPGVLRGIVVDEQTGAVLAGES